METVIRRLPHFSLPAQVLVGAVLGALFGLFVGDYAAVVKPIGTIYVMLLQSVVYPYIVASLIHGIGRLSPHTALKLFKRGWFFYLLLILVSFIVLVALTQFIPTSHSSIIIATNHTEIGHNLLKILIPANLIEAFTKNYVPSIVIFSIVFGIALQRYQNKEKLLNILVVTKTTSVTIWNWIIKLSPIAIFALIASTAGTINVENVQGVSTYLIIFYIGAFFLAFWLLPAIISVIAPVRYKEVINYLRDAFLISVATTLSVAALPAIEKAVHKIVANCNIRDDRSKELIETTTTISYPLAQLGNLFLYLFMVFAAFYFQRPIEGDAKLFLPLLTILSSIGSPSSSVNAAAFLAQWSHLPMASASLYVELMAITRYGQVLVSVMGMAFLTILVVLAYYHKLHVRLKHLFSGIVIFIAIIIGMTLVAEPLQDFIFSQPSTLLTFNLSSSLTKNVKVTMVTPEAAKKIPATEIKEDALSRIERTHVLRVGYNASMMPFVYFNNKKQLVGYDVAFMYALANTLNANIEFIPFRWFQLVKDIQENKFDIAIGSIYVTPGRLMEVSFTNPYFRSKIAFIAKRTQRNIFESAASIRAHKKLKIGVFRDPILLPIAKQNFPKSNLIVLPNYSDLQKYTTIDGFLWTQEHAQAYVTVNYKIYASVAPSGMKQASPLMMAFMINKNSPYFLNFLNYWLQLKENDGFSQQQASYWLQGRKPKSDQPRWSILRDVL